MRITFVTRCLDISMGGANASLHLLASMLSDRGYDVAIITVHPSLNDLPEDPPYELVVPEEKHVDTRVGIMYRTYQILCEYEERTDIFHVFRPVMHPGAGFYRYNGGKKPVIGRLNSYTMFCTNLEAMENECYRNCTVGAKFSHSNRSLPKRLAKLPLYVTRTLIEPSMVNHIDRFFAISPAVEDVYESIGVDPSKIAVVPNFLDPDFEPDSRPAGDAAGDFKLLYAGRLKRQKGVDILLQALSAVEGNVTLDIAGDGPVKDALENQVRELGLESSVTFRGWCDRDVLPDIYSQADLFVHPARLPEPFGRTIVESMQCGTPAVVSDTGGPPWIVGDAGATFASGNPADLRETIDRLREDRDELTRMENACSARLERFSPERIVSEIETEYRTTRQQVA